MLRPLQTAPAADDAPAVMPVIVFHIFGTLHQVTAAAPAVHRPSFPAVAARGHAGDTTMPETLVFRFHNPAPRQRPAGPVPLVFAGWSGALALAALALAAGLGWPAAVLAYALGGAAIIFASGLCALLAEAQPGRRLQPAPARARRR
jgi:hypothetical protein